MPDSERTLREAFEAIARIEAVCQERASKHVEQGVHDVEMARVGDWVEELKGDVQKLGEQLGEARRDATAARRFAMTTAVTIGAVLISALVAVLT